MESEACKKRYNSVDALKTSVNKAWASMSAKYIQDVCHSFRQRLQQVIHANGGYID